MSQTASGPIHQPDNALVTQVRAVGQTKLPESFELDISPKLKACVGDGRTPCQIDRLDSAMSVSGDMSHGAVRDMFAIAQSHGLKLRTTDHGPRGRRCHGSACLRVDDRTRDQLGSIRGYKRLRWYDPTDDPCQQCIANLTAIAEVDLFQSGRLVGHLQDGWRGHIPYTLHPPSLDVAATGVDQSTEPFIRDVKTVADVHEARSFAHERTDPVDKNRVGNFSIIT